jgi:hypothetical protein
MTSAINVFNSKLRGPNPTNTEAADELRYGAKSRFVPVHDSMGGYDDTPVLSDNIMTMARERGYRATPVDEDKLTPQDIRARFS